MEKMIKIDSNNLKNILDHNASSLVGKFCKRCETLSSIDDIKVQIKELIYENHRDLKTLLLAYESGRSQEEIKWIFKGKETFNGQPTNPKSRKYNT